MESLFRIKICGITNVADACAAAEAGTDAIGLNFFPRSPRYIDPILAREIAAALPAGVAKVGVFVNASPGEVREIASAVGLDFIQLHGDEPPELLSEFADRPLIKAFRCRDSDGQPVRDYLQQCGEHRALLAGVLLDAYVAGQFGGTGAKLDWAEVKNLQQNLKDMPVLLAGGLTADNVAAAIEAARPHGVDVASGVEASPGKKDARLVEKFVAEAKRGFKSICSSRPASHEKREGR